MNKRCKSVPVFALGIALATVVSIAALTTGVARADTGPAIPWWVLTGGGGTASGNGVTLNGTLGQPVTGSASGAGGVSMDAGYQQQAFEPAAVSDLHASIAGGQVQLDWTAVTHDAAGNLIDGVIYNVYRAQDDPYFTPDASYASGLTAPSFSDLDTTVLTGAHGTYYIVRSVYQGLLGQPSTRAGAFVFDLVKGS